MLERLFCEFTGKQSLQFREFEYLSGLYGGAIRDREMVPEAATIAKSEPFCDVQLDGKSRALQLGENRASRW